MNQPRNSHSKHKIPAALLYRTIFEQSPDGVLIIDTQGRIVEFNEAAHVQLGYSHEEFARLSLADIDPYETPEQIGASIEEVLTKGRADFEVKHVTRDGQIRDVYVITKAIAVQEGIFFLTIWRDITERKRTEESLRLHRLHLEELVEERSTELRELNEELRDDITRRALVEREREKLIADLREALAKIKILSGLLPMCAWCKKVRNDQGYWQKVETYVQEHSDASFTHGICPDCLKKVDPETYKVEIEKSGDTLGIRALERRRSPRLPTMKPQDYCISGINIRDWEKAALDAVVEDFSEGGMCIRTTSALPNDMLVLFQDSNGMKTGIVIWKEILEPESNLCKAGIKFIRNEKHKS